MLIDGFTPAYLRQTYLHGLEVSPAWQGSSGDAALTALIRTSLEVAQSRMGLRFALNRVLTYPDEGLVLGEDYEVEAQLLPYVGPLPGQLCAAMVLPFTQIRSIERVRLFGGGVGTREDPNLLATIEPQWLELIAEAGILKVLTAGLPGLKTFVSSSSTSVFPTGAWPGSYAGPYAGVTAEPYYVIPAQVDIPLSWAVDYTMGLGDIPFDVARWVGLDVAMQVLVSQDAGMGETSLTQDGITERIGYHTGKYGRYTGLISTWKCQQDAIDLDMLRIRYNGLSRPRW